MLNSGANLLLSLIHCGINSPPNVQESFPLTEKACSTTHPNILTTPPLPYAL